MKECRTELTTMLIRPMNRSGTRAALRSENRDYRKVGLFRRSLTPVLLCALTLFGFQVGAVHTELDLSKGEPTGEGYQDTSLEALVVRAQKQATSQDASSGG